MSIKPDGRLILLSNVNLTDYKNQYKFNSKQEQTNFFLNKKFKEYTEMRYIPQEISVSVNDIYDVLYYCDYLMFQNKNYSQKWFYAFITRKEYISDSVTKIYFEIDVYQTWQFDIDFKFKNFISRAQTRQLTPSNVPPFDQLFPESVEYGRDYVVTHTEMVSWNTYYALICASVDLSQNYGDEYDPSVKSSSGGTFDKMPSVLDYYVVDNINNNPSPKTSSLFSILESIKQAPWVAQCIQSVTIVPKELVGNNWSVITTASGQKIGKLPDGYESANFAIKSIADWWKQFPNYKNTKLYSYPYSYIEMTAYNGTQFIIKPECVNDTSELPLKLVNFVGASPRLAYFVQYYNDYGDNGVTLPNGEDFFGDFLDCGVSVANFPQLPVMVDNYLLYQANNANSFSLSNAINSYNKKEAVAFGAIEGGAGIISSLMNLSPGGALTSAYGGAKTAYTGVKNSEIAIRQQLAKIQDAEIAPPTLAGQTGGDAFNIANGITGITLKWKTIKPEYAERLEEYFTRYGYTINKIDYLSEYLHNNLNFNYIQTTGCLLGGNVPQQDLDIVKSMFDSGVTLWHNKNIGSYTDNPWI